MNHICNEDLLLFLIDAVRQMDSTAQLSVSERINQVELFRLYRTEIIRRMGANRG